MEKKLIGIICAIVLFTAGSASADITLFDQDRSGWESAVGVYEEEFFEDATLNPGLSVDSDYPGSVDTIKQVWWDRLFCSPATTTTWQFDTPLIGFGGYWNPGVPGGPGARIAVAINGSWVDVGEIPEAYTGEFWGFVSTEPFSQVLLEPGSACNGAWCETYELDNMVYSEQIEVVVDIKPGSCPNPLNLKSKGILPVAVLGTEEFDVTTIDPLTILLSREEVEEGVAPIRSDYEDVATPFDGELCDCHDLNGDGYADLTLKFKTQELVATIGLEEVAGEIIPLTLTGELRENEGGRPIEGEDCIWVLK